tara:strand:- start:2042 stop:2818 length:777 start_codon:yes stop_codon:yes gene_type:complete
MGRSRFIILLIFLSLFCKESGFAQLGISHEVGVLVGPASFLTDYGERYDLGNNINNSGFGIGLVHYINFAYRAECNCYSVDRYFNDHFKIRTELDFFRTNLEHVGPVAEKNNEGGKLLRAMHGKTQTFEIGTHLEYYPLSIRDFGAFSYLFMPFVSLGVHFVNYNPDAYSDFGPLTDDANVFPTFRGGIDLDGGSTWTIVGTAGARYKLSPVADLQIEGRFQYYDVDWIDGLNINAPQNKYNDVVFWFNVGFIYYLNY